MNLENGSTLNKGYYKAIKLRYESQMEEGKLMVAVDRRQ